MYRVCGSARAAASDRAQAQRPVQGLPGQAHTQLGACEGGVE